MPTSFIKLMIFKSYSEYLKKWLLSSSREYFNRVLTPPPLTIAWFQASLRCLKQRRKFKLKGLLNICLCTRKIQRAIKHLFIRAIHLSSKFRPSACRSVTEMFSVIRKFYPSIYKQSEYETSEFTHRTTQNGLRSCHFYLSSLIIFMIWKRIPCLRQKIIDRGNIHLITGKPTY